MQLNTLNDNMKETRIVELVIADDSQELAIDAISLVESPAIEQDFVFFGKEKNNLTFAKVDEEKRMLISPALIPNKQIFRYDPNTDSDYYVYFSRETVRKASELYLKHNNHHKATHEHNERVSGVLTVESWIKEGDQDKSKLYGFDLPNGTWFVKMKITNDDLWQKIKAGELKGLSIEGYFTNKFEQMQKKEPTDAEILSALNEIIKEKTELKAEKVELSIEAEAKAANKLAVNTLDELDQIENKFQNSEKAYLKIRKEFISQDSKTLAQVKKIKKVITQLKSIKTDYDKAAKDLGLNVSNLKVYQELVSNLKYAEGYAKSGLEQSQEIRKYIK